MAMIIKRNEPKPEIDKKIQSDKRINRLETEVDSLKRNANNTNKALLASMTGGLKL